MDNIDVKKRIMLLNRRVDDIEQTNERNMSNSGSSGQDSCRFVFRNYMPKNESLVADRRPWNAFLRECSTHSEEDAGFRPDSGAMFSSSNVLQKELQDSASEAIQLLPSHADADLKAKLETKLAKLQRRTQRAIVDMLREKLKEAELD
jgi:hypothetical protein